MLGRGLLKTAESEKEGGGWIVVEGRALSFYGEQ